MLNGCNGMLPLWGDICMKFAFDAAEGCPGGNIICDQFAAWD